MKDTIVYCHHFLLAVSGMEYVHANGVADERSRCEAIRSNQENIPDLLIRMSAIIQRHNTSIVCIHTPNNSGRTLTSLVPSPRKHTSI